MKKKDIKFDLSTQSFTISDLCFRLPSLQVGVDRLVYPFDVNWMNMWDRLNKHCWKNTGVNLNI